MQKTKKPRHSPGKSNRVRRGKAKSLSAQQTIPYLVMHPDGVCQLPGGIYTKTVEYGRLIFRGCHGIVDVLIFHRLCVGAAGELAHAVRVHYKIRNSLLGR